MKRSSGEQEAQRPDAPREQDERILAVNAALARCGGGDEAACKDFFAQLFRFREEVLRKFPGRSRRKWYDSEDAFSDVILEAYQAALKGDLKEPPEKNDWIEFLRQGMRKKLWLKWRRDRRILTGEEGARELLKVEAPKEDDPARRAETSDELEATVSQVKEVLSEKQRAVFFATAQGMTQEEAARAARTTPGAARVHAQRAEKKLEELRERLKRSQVA